jgi:hypothetical protein
MGAPFGRRIVGADRRSAHRQFVADVNWRVLGVDPLAAEELLRR